MPTSHVLTLSCPDRPGIVHAVASALLDVGGNIVENAQFGDSDTGLFCMRTEFEAAEDDPSAIAQAVRHRLADDAANLHVRRASHRPRVVVLVSKADHCLVDLLYRWRSGDLQVDVVAVVSNHPDCEPLVGAHGIEFLHWPVTSSTKRAQEVRLLALVEERGIELVVLARYMQILSDDVCAALAGRAINIHHSFLPGFKGARPYHQAHARGVKLVGATAHFVTAELDEGPIIEQDVVRVTHAHTPAQLVALGQDVERSVLSRAVRYWAEDRVLLVGHKTVVFP